MGNKNGFTLVELLAVIVILGVILLLAIPSVSKIITESKEKTFLINAQNYIKQAKVLNYESQEELVIYNISQLSENLTSPYGGEVTGKVSAIKNSETNEYEYYIYMEDTKGNIVGNKAINGMNVSIKESELNNFKIKTEQEFDYNNEELKYKYQYCINEYYDCMNNNSENDSYCKLEYININDCKSYSPESFVIHNNPLLNANIYDDNDITIFGDPYSNDAKIYPEYVVEENFQYSTGAGVTVNLSENKKNIAGTIINRINENEFEVLINEDFYPSDKTNYGTFILKNIYDRLNKQLLNSTNANYWNNVEDIRLLSIGDFNRFAGILKDSGKLTCDLNGCKNTISSENYQKIINIFKVGNIHTRRYNNNLCIENCTAAQEKTKNNFLANYYYADTWLMDESICKYNGESFEGKCPVVDFFTNSVFLQSDLTKAKANVKLVVKINKNYINFVE